MQFLRARVIRALVALAAGLVVGAGCHSSDRPLGVSLTPFVSDSDARPQVPANPKVKIFISMSDARQDVTKIGENREEDQVRLVYSSGSTPAEFIREIVSREFAAAGMTVVIDRAQANRLLSVSVTQFFVMEKGTYQAQVNVTADVADESGKKLWTRNVSGANGTWGRSYRARNYQQVLTAATVEIAASMLKDQDFVKAVQIP